MPVKKAKNGQESESYEADHVAGRRLEYKMRAEEQIYGKERSKNHRCADKRR